MTIKDPTKFNRFDFEQQIMSCWNVTSDLATIYAEVSDSDDMSEDQLINVLLGIKELYELKFNELFRQFELGVESGDIN